MRRGRARLAPTLFQRRAAARCDVPVIRLCVSADWLRPVGVGGRWSVEWDSSAARERGHNSFVSLCFFTCYPFMLQRRRKIRRKKEKGKAISFRTARPCCLFHGSTFTLVPSLESNPSRVLHLACSLTQRERECV